MKGKFFLIVFGLGLIGLSGCYTIPRHYVTQEIIVYYPPPPPPPPDYYYPQPPPSPPVYYPPSTGTNPQRDRLPEKPKDSYGPRDPLQGGDHRGSGETKTDPPVRNPVEKDRGHQ